MYYCQFPNCNYSTKDRKCIEHHHIIPKELNGSNRKFNRIWLCPNHHSLIYVPNSTSGKHSIATNVILIRKLLSTSGTLLEYSEDGEVKYFPLNEY